MEKVEYRARLQAVIPKMPKYYGVLIAAKHPGIKPRDIYNVVAKGTYNEQVLLAMEDVFLSNDVNS